MSDTRDFQPGEPGKTGERGDSGQRGVQGERGMKGDHGQHGETGSAGAQGETGSAGTTGDIGNTGQQGERGKQGDQGQQGSPADVAVTDALSERVTENTRKIENSRLNRRTVRRAFLAVILVAFAVTAAGGYEANQARNDANDVRKITTHNRWLIAQVQRLQQDQLAFRKMRAKQTTASDLKLCREIETVKAIQRRGEQRRRQLDRDYLKANPNGTPSISRKVVLTDLSNIMQTIKELAPTRCKLLPSVKKVK